MRETIGRYRVVKQLGAGGMGDVFLAEDPRLHRLVALKVISGEMDRAKRARFEREAHAASILTHPNICSVHEIGETEDGTLFIAMEFVEGTSLSERLRAGRLSVSEVLEIAIEVADALTEAHRHGVFHRDIKPANVMLTVGGRVKVVDFGLAHTRQEISVWIENTPSTAPMARRALTRALRTDRRRGPLRFVLPPFRNRDRYSQCSWFRGAAMDCEGSPWQRSSESVSYR